MNSFRNVEMAVDYEVKRQKAQWEKTHQTIDDAPKCTRGWDAERGVSFGQREKEDTADYRYFPDPDLIPVTMSADEVKQIKATLPETPVARRERFQTSLGLSEYDANVIIDQGPQFTAWFEEVVDACGDAKTAANWATQDVLRDLKAADEELEDFPITSEILGGLLKWVTDDRLTTKSAREIYSILKDDASSGETLSLERVDTLASERETVNDTGALTAAIEAAIQAQPKAAEDVRSGKHAAVGPMMGMVMKQVSGADPKVVRAMLLETLAPDS